MGIVMALFGAAIATVFIALIYSTFRSGRKQGRDGVISEKEAEEPTTPYDRKRDHVEPDEPWPRH